MGKVSGLGHFGIYVEDMATMVDFYSNVLGLTVTDRGERGDITFLSAQPQDEHHEIVLVARKGQRTVAGQVSFHVDSLADLQQMHARLVDHGTEFVRIVNHGIAFGAYFRDPEDNVLEVYWATGRDYPQPFAEPIDLTRSADELLAAVDTLPPAPAHYPRFYGRESGKRVITEQSL